MFIKTNSKKGFTMVELLGAIVILGLMMTVAIVGVTKVLESTKKNYYKSQMKEMTLAAKSYTTDNRNALPKNIGAKTTISLNKLQDKNYIESIKDYSKKICDGEKSYVQVFKYSKTEYSYSSHLECPSYNSDDAGESGLKPGIDITYIKDDGNPTKLAVKVEMTGSITDAETKLLGYNYIVYRDSAEVINSGQVSAGNRTSKDITIDLSKYQSGTLRIKVTATNIYGNQTSSSRSLNSNDKVPPVCGEITGAGTNWLTTPDAKREITIKCSDSESGCSKESFTKVFTEDQKIGQIKISDNNGNEKKCDVNVYIDKSAPTININVFKRNDKGDNTGSSILNIKTENTNRIKTLNTYPKTTNGWLNNTNYQYGVNYQITASDSVSLGTGTKTNSLWWWNNGNLKSNDKNINEVAGTSTRKLSGKKFDITYSLSGQGYRVAQYEVADEAGNKSVVKIVAPIDRSKPSKPKLTNSSNGNWTKNDVTVKMESSDTLSGLDNFRHRTATNKSYEIYSSKNASSYQQKFTTTSNYTLRISICDKAGNCSDEATTNIKVDKKNPTAGTFVISGTKGSNNWYKTDVKLSAKNGSDAESGHKETKISKTSITGDTKGTKVTITTTDKVGNTATRDETIKVDKSAPSVGLTISSRDSGYHTKNINYSISASDSTSGIAKYCFKSGSKCTPNTTTSSKSNVDVGFTKYDGSTKTLYGCATNNAGLTTCKSVKYTVKNSVTVKLGDSGPICPDNQTNTSRSQCVKFKYNRAFVDKISKNGTKVKISGHAQNNGLSTITVDSGCPTRNICIADKSTNDVRKLECKKKLKSFKISGTSYAGSGENFAYFTDKEFDVSDWNEGKYRLVILPDADEMKNNSKCKAKLKDSGYKLDHWTITSTRIKDATPTLFEIEK